MGLRKKRPRPAIRISYRWFQGLVRYYLANRLRGVTPGETTPWRHPWETTLQWNDERKLWTAKIEPGFCESSAADPRPHYRMKGRHAPEVTRERLGLSRESEEIVDVPLTEEPDIDLPEFLWRPLGTEAVGTAEVPPESVPQYFINQGVAPAVILRESEAGGLEQVIEGNLEERSNARLLRAVDIILSHERSRTEAQFAVAEDGVVSLEMGISRPSQPVRSARIHRRRKWEPPADFGPLEHLLNPLIDDGIDERILCTVYLMSERGVTPGTPIDETWIATPSRHFVFWNLQYRERYETRRIEPFRFDYNGIGLGQGNLDALADSIQRGQNQQIAEMESTFNTAKAEGRFYSA